MIRELFRVESNSSVKRFQEFCVVFLQPVDNAEALLDTWLTYRVNAHLSKFSNLYLGRIRCFGRIRLLARRMKMYNSRRNMKSLNALPGHHLVETFDETHLKTK